MEKHNALINSLFIVGALIILLLGVSFADTYTGNAFIDKFIKRTSAKQQEPVITKTLQRCNLFSRCPKGYDCKNNRCTLKPKVKATSKAQTIGSRITAGRKAPVDNIKKIAISPDITKIVGGKVVSVRRTIDFNTNNKLDPLGLFIAKSNIINVPININSPRDIRNLGNFLNIVNRKIDFINIDQQPGLPSGIQSGSFRGGKNLAHYMSGNGFDNLWVKVNNELERWGRGGRTVQVMGYDEMVLSDSVGAINVYIDTTGDGVVDDPMLAFIGDIGEGAEVSSETSVPSESSGEVHTPINFAPGEEITDEDGNILVCIAENGCQGSIGEDSDAPVAWGVENGDWKSSSNDDAEAVKNILNYNGYKENHETLEDGEKHKASDGKEYKCLSVDKTEKCYIGENENGESICYTNGDGCYPIEEEGTDEGESQCPPELDSCGATTITADTNSPEFQYLMNQIQSCNSPRTARVMHCGQEECSFYCGLLKPGLNLKTDPRFNNQIQCRPELDTCQDTVVSNAPQVAPNTGNIDPERP